MRTLSFKVPETLERRLMRAVKQRRVRKSVVVREALERYLDESLPEPEATFLEMTRHLHGCVKGAPADLSSNARHLADFGR
jgi:hypothetical protein